MAGTGIKQFESFCIARTSPEEDAMTRAVHNVVLGAIKDFKSIAPKNRMRRKSIAYLRMRPALRTDIWKLHEKTGLTQLDIATKLGINQARVNEVLQFTG